MINLTITQKINMTLICHLYVNLSIGLLSIFYKCLFLRILLNTCA